MPIYCSAIFAGTGGKYTKLGLNLFHMQGILTESTLMYIHTMYRNREALILIQRLGIMQ